MTFDPNSLVFVLQDMTARDLLQQRYTLPNGDTAWRPSPLVAAAIEGKLLVLDGIHRVNLGTLAVLSRYCSTETHSAPVAWHPSSWCRDYSMKVIQLLFIDFSSEKKSNSFFDCFVS